jgi:hypothetical protein
MIATLLAGAASCSPTAPSQDRLSITGTLSLSAIGKTSQLVATWTKADGTSQNVTNDSQWSTDNPSVATISSTGLLTAVGFGSTRVTAQYGHLMSAPMQAQVATLVVTALHLSGNVSLTAVGETSQLTLMATLSDGTSADVTSAAAWQSSDTSVAAIQPNGMLTATGLGVTNVSVLYQGRSASATVIVTPPGTIATTGRVRLPGAGESSGLGVPGFQVVDTRSGQTTTTNAQGHYTMAGLTIGDRLAFSKDDFEPAELTVTGPDGDVTVQKVVRLAAGDAVQWQAAPNDMMYNLTPNPSCINCRLIRVNINAAGTLHLTLSWDAKNAESLWINGQFYPGTSPGPLKVDVPVGPGELVVYAGMTILSGYVNLTLNTALTSSEPPLKSRRP